MLFGLQAVRTICISRGSEWPTMVVVDNSANFLCCHMLCEAITRARNHLFIISRIKNSFWHGIAQVMRGAVDHDTQDCPGMKRRFKATPLVEWAFGGRTVYKNGNTGELG